MKITSVFLVILCLPIPSFAWGPEGHEVIADIARAHLNQTAKGRIRELIGTDDLASISTWADEIRSERPQTYGWHFVDIPMNAAGFSEPRDCFRVQEEHPQSAQDHHNCVVDRIEIFQRVLADKSAAKNDRIEALKFLVHLVGDVHQPLHAVAEARGGNDVHVVEFGSSMCGTRPCNLHFAWDIALIEHTGRSETEYMRHLEKFIANRKLQNRGGGSPADWANESFHLAHEVWLNNGRQVDETYFRRNIPIVDERLAIAGLRLARWLNSSVGKEPHNPGE